MPRRRRLAALVPAAAIALLIVAAAVAASWTGGHLVRGEFAAQHGATFDFSRPPCAPAAPRAALPGEVAVRYLGVGGHFVEWRGVAVLFAPFFSNPGLGRVLAGRWQPDMAAIAAGLADVPLERVGAIVVGHTHYDHFAEIPEVAPRTPPTAPIYVNRSGTRMLAPYPDLRARAVALEDEAGSWLQPADSSGAPLPLRLRALPSAHAPHVDHYLWARGEVETPWTAPWSGRPLSDFVTGQPFAMVLELLDPDTRRVRFRLYYGDAAAPAGQGYPPPEVDGDGHGWDLAILCVPNYGLVDAFPEGIVGRLRPRHVLAVHYEDFFRARARPLRFVPPLGDGRLDRFLRRLRDALAAGGQAPRAPLGTVCGPSLPGFTMPLPGEQLRFAVLQ